MVLKLHGINFLIYVVRSQYKPAGILQVKMKERREKHANIFGPYWTGPQEHVN